MQSNDGVHLSGGILDNQEWQTRWRDLAVMPTRKYDVTSGRVGRLFVQAMAAELTGVWQRLWNAEVFIVFQMVILQHARNVTK